MMASPDNHAAGRAGQRGLRAAIRLRKERDQRLVLYTVSCQ